MRKRKERNRQPGNISRVRGPFGPARIFSGCRRIAGQSRGCAAGAGSLQCKIYQAIPYISEVRGQKSYRGGAPARLSLATARTRTLPAKTREGSGASAKGRARQSLEKSPQTGGLKMSAMAGTVGQTRGMSKDEKFVIFASSLGTIFEWYDFYLYAVLAPFFAALFFPAGNDTAALLSAFATYAAGFLVRPFGAVIFGRIGDLVGRKYTFLVTIMVMGSATFLVGVLPTYAAVGWLAPILLVTLRLYQGLALGGEYGGAATYVAEHARPHERGYATSWIQTTATLGLLLALVII